MYLLNDVLLSVWPTCCSSVLRGITVSKLGQRFKFCFLLSENGTEMSSAKSQNLTFGISQNSQRSFPKPASGFLIAHRKRFKPQMC